MIAGMKLRPFVFLTPVFGIAIAIGVFAATSGGNFFAPVQSFYGIVAGIIPLLIIAFAVEKSSSEFFRQARIYRIVLFLFLLVGELCALLGASGALRPPVSDFRKSDDPVAAADSSFDHGYVAFSQTATNVIIAGTLVGLGCGFLMITAMAVLPDVVTRSAPEPETAGGAGDRGGAGQSKPAPASDEPSVS
jgi:hypothetical protein